MVRNVPEIPEEQRSH